MDFQRATKSDLITYVNTLQAEKDAATAAATYYNSRSNYFEQILAAIELVLFNSPFINKDGKFFKKLGWILLNIGTVKALIEDIIAKVKQWRAEVERVKAELEKQGKSDALPK